MRACRVANPPGFSGILYISAPSPTPSNYPFFTTRANVTFELHKFTYFNWSGVTVMLIGFHASGM